MALGHLERVDIRTEWQHEAYRFTPWLAKDANLQILADEIGIDLELEDTEVYIGSYKADIVARSGDGQKVIIENQLSRTDHKHLGQLITYASGLDARIVIWICTEVTDEHRQAIDWLNDLTTAEVSFFACQIELWKIGNSDPAPKFQLVSSPNDWSKTVKSSASVSQLSDTKRCHLEFWNTLKEHMVEAGTGLRLQTPRPQHWYPIAVGRSNFIISLTTKTQAQRVGCEIFINGKKAKKAFAQLLEGREAIEKDLGELDWQELPEGQGCRIAQYREGDTKNLGKWDELHAWCKDRAEEFHRVFSPRIKSVVLTEE